MSLYLLDTDTLSLLQQGHVKLLARLNRTPLVDLAISTITLLEQMQGWQASIAKARDNAQMALVHERLVTRLLPTWRRLPTIPMTESALDRFGHLRALKLNIPFMDLRIASLALDQSLIVVTRNLRDFGRVPSLVAEDWSV